MARRHVTNIGLTSHAMAKSSVTNDNVPPRIQLGISTYFIRGGKKSKDEILTLKT
jgi:hypothetical protein